MTRKRSEYGGSTTEYPVPSTEYQVRSTEDCDPGFHSWCSVLGTRYPRLLTSAAGGQAVRSVSELLYLKPGELGRAWPFFLFYLLLFGAFSVADGVSLALFVKRVGADRLPLYYAITAIANVVLIGGYVWVAERVGGQRMFQAILGGTVAVYATAWAALRWLDGGPAWYGALFVTREIAFTLVLMHFGTYLQDYFSREELNRVLPVVYAGGRVGGIAGGWLLEHLSGPLGPLNLVPVFLGLCLVCMGVLVVVSRRFRPLHAPEDEHGDPATFAPAEDRALERQARTSLGSFVRFVWASPLLFWMTVSAVLYMVVRWFLNYQYNAFFQIHFADSRELADFLGRRGCRPDLPGQRRGAVRELAGAVGRPGGHGRKPPCKGRGPVGQARLLALRGQSDRDGF